MTDDLAALDATDQAALVRSGDATPLELVDAAITRIEKLNPELNAVIHPLFDRARALAADTALPDGPFRGVPVVVKDLDGTLAGAPYHAGSRLLKQLEYTPRSTSYLFRKLEAAGCVIVGKTNTPEDGLVPTTEPLAYGPTRNPWGSGHATGGSSGGSAAAVASRMVAVGHGGDGGGSIRIPAAHCGIVGLKPSRGRISHGPDEHDPWAGFVQRHVLTRSVRDTAVFLDVLAGAMPGDPYTAPPPSRPYTSEVGADPGTLRIGVLTDVPNGMAEVSPDCAAAAEGAARLLESLGHTVEAAAPAAFAETALVENFVTVITAQTALTLAEWARLAGRELTPDDVEPATWPYHENARAIDSVTYVRAVEALQGWTRRVVAWWTDGGYDLLLTPTCAEPPPVLGDMTSTSDEPLRPFVRSIPFVAFTAPFNVTGQPAISLPLHWNASELPVGVQLVAAPYREDVLLRVAAQLELARPWADRRPIVHA